MAVDPSRSGSSGSTNQPDMDKLMREIHEFLRAENEEDASIVRSVPGEHEPALEGEVVGDPEDGPLPGGNPEALGRVGWLARVASYVVQGLVMLALIAAVSIAWPSRLHLVLALLAILAGGLVGVVLLLGVHARIGLLLDIEENTRRIARNKTRIAAMLERIWIV